jgi:type I restriction enzyme S subunit
LAPLEEQKEMVSRIEALFKLADQIERRVAAARERAERLTQVILAKAFRRGELLATEAELARLEGRHYEPASVLLAKIKAQRKEVKPQWKRSGLKTLRN